MKCRDIFKEKNLLTQNPFLDFLFFEFKARVKLFIEKIIYMKKSETSKNMSKKLIFINSACTIVISKTMEDQKIPGYH